MALMALTLSFSAAGRADAGSSAPVIPDASSAAPASASGPSVKPESANADMHSAAIRRRPTHPPVGQRIDEAVRRLTRSLDLNPEQQAKLRQILLDQQRQIIDLRSRSLDPGADRAALNLAILDQTKERIRAMLNEEQKKKYTTDVPRDQTAPMQADLQHWMQMQESNRRKSGGESK